MAYWLFKSEPDCFSFADLMAAPDRTTGWDGVRNFQARNFLRDEVKLGDGVLYYHSNADPPAIAGIAEVVREGHPDPTAFDPTADHHDPRAGPSRRPGSRSPSGPCGPIDPPLAPPRLARGPGPGRDGILRKGSRLSIQPVRPEEWAAVLELAGIPASPSRR